MTHYEKLGLSKKATEKEIKDAYKALVKKYHPDVYQGDKTYAEKMIKEINCAYDILSDPIKKAEYDEEINPTTYTYTPPSYNYTPPKYDTPPSHYNDYRKNYSEDYNYNYRYTNYHRNKTPNSNYTGTSPLEDKIINIFDTNKIIVVFLVLIIYITLLIFTFCQFYAFKNNNYTGTIINSKKVENQTTRNTIIVDNDIEDNNYNTNSFPDNYEDFNINDYISDSELYEVYKEYFYDDFDSFSEFKETMSKELYSYYSELY